MADRWTTEEWAERRERAYAFLERERADRLSRLTPKAAREIVARIFAGPQPPAVERETGLIERQRLFMRLR